MGTLPNGGVKCKGVWKKLQFPTNISILIARKRLKIDGYMLRCVWQALNPLFIHINLPRLSQGRTQGRPKCALGWLQKLTHVPLAIAILLVTSIILSLPVNVVDDVNRRFLLIVNFNILYLLNNKVCYCHRRIWGGGNPAMPPSGLSMGLGPQPSKIFTTQKWHTS